MEKNSEFEDYFANEELASAQSLMLSDHHHSGINYLDAAIPANTRRAYQADIRHYQKVFGGSLPASTQDILDYLNWCAPHLNPNTIKRRLSTLRLWHLLQEYNDPTQHQRVKKTLRGIARVHGKPKKKAHALSLEALHQLIDYLNQETTLKNLRDKAGLLMGYYGAFRRSELVTHQLEQIEWVKEGLLIHLPRSKTDQTGKGVFCPIPFGPDHYCPVRALLEWRDAAGLQSGSIYRRLTNRGNVLPQAISAGHWNTAFKALAKKAAVPMAEKMSSHSLRRGSTTESHRRGATPKMLQKHGRWKSGAMVLEYIDDAKQFEASAASLLNDF